AGQVARLNTFREARDDGAVRSEIDAIRQLAASDGNLMPALVGAVKKGVTLGEISDALREEWGTWDG
ncbi:MAG: methylmalonyl-CoA mutase family protein, partial [Longimicrobiales bacterium]